jgi:hypothetical protein
LSSARWSGPGRGANGTLLTASSSGVVKVATVDQPLDPKAGDTLLGFMTVE